MTLHNDENTDMRDVVGSGMRVMLVRVEANNRMHVIATTGVIEVAAVVLAACVCLIAVVL